jgi:hypothetical protein
MDLPEDDITFLKDVVKATRQRPHLVTWQDRDGTERHTALTQPDVVRLNQLAARLKISKSETLRQAAHIPVVKTPKPAELPGSGSGTVGRLPT